MVSMLASSLLALGAAGLAISYDNDSKQDKTGHNEYWSNGWIEPGEDVEPVSNATYREECGACHLAYQPGLLPGDAWQRIMETSALLDHYGDDASLPQGLQDELLGYLTANAADKAVKTRSRAFSLGTTTVDALPRITKTRYFRNEHHEIPAHQVSANAQVGSFSQCNTCHTGADTGVYNGHRVRIPGYGRWDD